LNTRSAVKNVPNYGDFRIPLLAWPAKPCPAGRGEDRSAIPLPPFQPPDPRLQRRFSISQLQGERESLVASTFWAGHPWVRAPPLPRNAAAGADSLPQQNNRQALVVISVKRPTRNRAAVQKRRSCARPPTPP